MKKLRIYVDTSVVGGCFDTEFAADSQALMEMARDGKAVLIVSDLLVREIQSAPEPVRNLYTSLPSTALEYFLTNEEAVRLHDAYLAAGVVGPGSDDDAQHVANATRGIQFSPTVPGVHAQGMLLLAAGSCVDRPRGPRGGHGGGMRDRAAASKPASKATWVGVPPVSRIWSSAHVQFQRSTTNPIAANFASASGVT
jgi:hypothetical protein